MDRLNRRQFLGTTAAAAVASATTLTPAADTPATSPGITDVNVYLPSWPFRQLPSQEPAELAAMLRSKGVTQAWTSSFDGVFHRNLGGANRRLAEACQAHDLFIPFGSINPRLPDWEEELRRCQEIYRMPGIRLHPGYHGYTLDDPTLAKLLRLAAKRNLIVQLVGWLEDERTQHPLLAAKEADLRPLAKLAPEIPGLRLVISNGIRSPYSGHLKDLFALESTWFDFAVTDGIDCLGELLKRFPLERLLFGSYSPMFYFESNALKLDEAAVTADQRHALQSGNATSLLNLATR